MAVRRMMLGVAAVVAMCGAAGAKPPGTEVPEGRELDPVARDFFLAPPGANTESAPAGPAGKQHDVVGASFMSSLRESVTAWFTIPLGTVQPAGGIR